jgi:hypothetical protein
MTSDVIFAPGWLSGYAAVVVIVVLFNAGEFL